MRGKYEVWWDGLSVEERMADVAKHVKPECVKDKKGEVLGWSWRWFPMAKPRDGAMLEKIVSVLRKFGKIGGFVWSHSLGKAFVQLNPNCLQEVVGKHESYRRVADDKLKELLRVFRVWVNVNRWVMQEEALMWVTEPKPSRCEKERKKSERRVRSEKIKRLPWKRDHLKKLAKKRVAQKKLEEKQKLAAGPAVTLESLLGIKPEEVSA